VRIGNRVTDIAEQRLLLALDFASGVSDVLGQPFRLRFATGSGWREHIPDFLVVTAEGGLLIDVRPGGRIGDDDRVCLAAARKRRWRPLWVSGRYRLAATRADQSEFTPPPGHGGNSARTRLPPWYGCTYQRVVSASMIANPRPPEPSASRRKSTHRTTGDSETDLPGPAHRSRGPAVPPPALPAGADGEAVDDSPRDRDPPCHHRPASVAADTDAPAAGAEPPRASAAATDPVAIRI
jgi:hypothetical protein